MIRYVYLVVKRTQSLKIHPHKEVEGIYLDSVDALARVVKLNDERSVDLYGRPVGPEYDLVPVAAAGKLAKLLTMVDDRVKECEHEKASS